MANRTQKSQKSEIQFTQNTEEWLTNRAGLDVKLVKEMMNLPELERAEFIKDQDLGERTSEAYLLLSNLLRQNSRTGQHYMDAETIKSYWEKLHPDAAKTAYIEREKKLKSTPTTISADVKDEVVEEIYVEKEGKVEKVQRVEKSEKSVKQEKTEEKQEEKIIDETEQLIQEGTKEVEMIDCLEKQLKDGGFSGPLALIYSGANTEEINEAIENARTEANERRVQKSEELEQVEKQSQEKTVKKVEKEEVVKEEEEKRMPPSPGELAKAAREKELEKGKEQEEKKRHKEIQRRGDDIETVRIGDEPAKTSEEPITETQDITEIKFEEMKGPEIINFFKNIENEDVKRLSEDQIGAIYEVISEDETVSEEDKLDLFGRLYQ